MGTRKKESQVKRVWGIATNMIIALDIDDVIFDTSGYLSSILEDLQDDELDQLKLEIMRGNYRVPKVREFLAKYLLPTIDNAKLMKGADETIKELKKQGHTIILVTARGDKAFPGSEEKSEQALARNNIVYDKVVYNCQDKAEVCKANKVDAFVDDSPRNCVDVRAGLSIPVIGFESVITANGLKEANIPSVRTWKELEEALAKITAPKTAASDNL